MTSAIPRRAVLVAGLGGVGALGACTGSTPASGMRMPTTPVPTSPPASPSPGQRVVERVLTPAPTRADLGGVAVDTWAYDGAIPGRELRVTAGDFVRVRLHNGLPAKTTVHWHGIRLRNPADGLPGITQNPVEPGADYIYAFTPPDPGTYFFHPHVGVQIDRGLYAPLIVEDPHEPLKYDADWVVVLDDWLDGTGRTPDQALADLVKAGGTASGSGMGGMGMGMGGMGGMTGGDDGDVTYPYFLVNGRTATDPATFAARPGQVVRLRVINSAADTIFTIALGGHRLTITHTDGWPVAHRETSAVTLGMGERFDALVTLGDGAFPLVAQPAGKSGQAHAVVRTAAGATPDPGAGPPTELSGTPLQLADLTPADAARLPRATAQDTHAVLLQGSMVPYVWGINGAPYGQNTPLTVSAGQRVRFEVTNMSMMTHPFHLHGHTFALADTGLRKDTVLLRHMERRVIEFDTDNSGRWMAHCHNAYHGEAGMMIGVDYRT